MATNPEFAVIKHEYDHIKEGDKIVLAAGFEERHLTCARENDVALETIDGLIIWDVRFSIFFYPLLREAKIYQVY